MNPEPAKHPASYRPGDHVCVYKTKSSGAITAKILKVDCTSSSSVIMFTVEITANNLPNPFRTGLKNFGPGDILNVSHHNIYPDLMEPVDILKEMLR